MGTMKKGDSSPTKKIIMNKKLFIPETYCEDKEYIRLTSSGCYFSANFMKNNHLTKSNSVRFYEFDDNQYKFGIEFSNSIEFAGGFSLVRTGRSVNSCMTNPRSFISNYPILRELTKDKTNKNRFKITYDKLEKCFVFNIVPSFEFKDYPHSIPDGAVGVYRYKDTSGHIIYIGRGNIKDRLKSPERKNWDVNIVEYSLVKDQAEMKKYENYHIKEYKALYNKLPEYNLISGSEY